MDHYLRLLLIDPGRLYRRFIEIPFCIRFADGVPFTRWAQGVIFDTRQVNAGYFRGSVFISPWRLCPSHGQSFPYPSLAVRARNGRVADQPTGTRGRRRNGSMSALPCSRHLTLTGDRLRHVQDCQSGYTSVHRPFQAVERLDALAQLPALHKPFGVQSCTTVVGICDD